MRFEKHYSPDRWCSGVNKTRFFQWCHSQFIELLLLLAISTTWSSREGGRATRIARGQCFLSLPLLHRCVQTFGNSAVHRDTGWSLETPDHGVPCLIINLSWLRSVIRGIWRAPGITSEEHNVGSYLWESCGKASSQALGSQTRGRQKRRRKKKKKQSECVKSAFFFVALLSVGTLIKVKWLGRNDLWDQFFVRKPNLYLPLFELFMTPSLFLVLHKSRQLLDTNIFLPWAATNKIFESWHILAFSNSRAIWFACGT